MTRLSVRHEESARNIANARDGVRPEARHKNRIPQVVLGGSLGMQRSQSVLFSPLRAQTVWTNVIDYSTFGPGIPCHPLCTL